MKCMTHFSPSSCNPFPLTTFPLSTLHILLRFWNVCWVWNIKKKCSRGQLTALHTMQCIQSFKIQGLHFFPFFPKGCCCSAWMHTYSHIGGSADARGIMPTRTSNIRCTFASISAWHWISSRDKGAKEEDERRPWNCALLTTLSYQPRLLMTRGEIGQCPITVASY